jgi:hypothetical protein
VGRLTSSYTAELGQLGRILPNTPINRIAFGAGALFAVTTLPGDGQIFDDIALDRSSNVHPALSTHSPTARAIVAASAGEMQNWQAHHLVTFAAVAALPRDVQLAIASSGWQMDSLRNLVALPMDDASYRALPNAGLLPQHRGPHPNYSAEVAAQLTHVSTNYRQMTPPQIYFEMSRIESYMMGRLLQRSTPLGIPNYHPRVN